MTADVFMPKLGVEMTEARVLAWHAEEGARVQRGDVLVTIETEKVTYDIQAEADGFVHIVAPVDAQLPVGAVLGRVARTREEYAGLVGGGAVPMSAGDRNDRGSDATLRVAGDAGRTPVGTAASDERGGARTSGGDAADRERGAVTTSGDDRAHGGRGAAGTPVGDATHRERVAARTSGRDAAHAERGAVGTPGGGAAANDEHVKAPSAHAAPGVTAREVRATPLARKLAREHGIDLAALTGSGVGGRIREADVLSALERRGQRGPAPISQAGTPAEPASAPADSVAAATSPATIAASTPSTPAGPVPASAAESRATSARRVARRTPFTGIRKVIARNLHHGLQTMAQMTDLGEMDVTEIVRLRDQLNREPRLVGAEVTYTDLFVKAAALVLRELPIFNATLEADEIVEWADVNVAVAVSVERGLLVPVVHRAGERSVPDIHAELTRLVERARAAQLTLDDVSGATFTVTNFGSYGSYMGTPLINPPQVAILGTGQIVEKPVVQAGQIVVRWMMGYALTIDHRVLDGADAGRFMARFRDLAERPAVLLLGA